MRAIRALILGVFRQVLRIYFRKVTVAGEAPAPGAASRLFLPNHVNGLIDPLLVLTTAECPISPIGKAPLWKIPILGFLLDAVGAVPVVRRRDDPTKAAGANDELFDKIGSHLAKGGNILIFPEGTSHNEPHLVKMRTGPARMMLRGRAAGAGEVTFQAVGLEFEARDIFRSRTLVLYGPVRKLDDIAPASLATEEAASAVTGAIERDLQSLVVTGESWEERQLISRVAELLAHQSDEPTFSEWSELARSVRDVGRDLQARSPHAIDPVRAGVSAYYEVLEREGLVDRDVIAESRGSEAPIRHGRIGPTAMLLLLPLAALGFVLYAIPYQIPRLVAARGTTADVASTVKLAVGLVLFPLWAAALATLSIIVLPSPWGTTFALASFATPLPALFWLDAFEDGLLRRRATPEALRELRARALAAIDSARSQLPPAGQVAS